MAILTLVCWSVVTWRVEGGGLLHVLPIVHECYNAGYAGPMGLWPACAAPRGAVDDVMTVRRLGQ